jgi:hypothetical protein
MSLDGWRRRDGRLDDLRCSRSAGTKTIAGMPASRVRAAVAEVAVDAQACAK